LATKQQDGVVLRHSSPKMARFGGSIWAGTWIGGNILAALHYHGLLMQVMETTGADD
jgi:hypothetical protein